MIRRWLAAVLLLGASGAWAVDTTDSNKFDLGLRFGTLFGTLTKDVPESDGSTTHTEFGYNGVIVGVDLHFDLMRWFGFAVGGHFVFDAANIQVTRKGVDFTFFFPVLGGVRRTISEYDYMVVMERDPYGLALMLRTGFHSYNPSSKTNPDDSVEGSVFSNEAGAEFRLDFGDRTSFSLSVLYSIYTLPSSNVRVGAQNLTIEGGWRIFL